ncbi:NodT family efflux transporter outer membrane factor (OMF) lipoprotein [Pelomonas aquatica]|uniref:NodT family efflux transporter outer membrane factor (OMF) lipoprotein n=1 Tax=Pelomonas aquatica TaxID=431058 RepID=A0ABU1ZG33_9BURK|nr:efflux transporter outer membrane subunit [Pelomonas aquatica]MDR7299599.1 NodT family efflux transporter outer membrane factor (OMF) lipoprotein [Pelomonas aquatica]
MLIRLTPLALAALVGCAAPSLSQGPQNLAPAQFTQLPSAAPGAATMTAAFVDSAQLQRVVDEVLANNRDLRAAAARLKQAEALATAAGAQRLPTVGVGASASRQRAPNDQGQFNTFSSYGVNATAGWEVDLWGRAAAAAQAAGYDAESAALDRDAAQLSLAGTALNLQAQLIGLGHRLKLAKETLVVQNQLLDLVKARVGAGRNTALDQARAEALVAQTSASVPALRNAACLTRLQLDVLRGQPPADCDKADSDPLPGMPQPRLISLGTLPDPAGLLAQRPDVKAAAVRAQAAASRAHVAWAARWPSVGLTGQIGWSAGAASDLFKSATRIHSLAAALNWNFLDFGARKAEESAARAGFEAAVAAAEQAQLAALQDAQGSLSTLRETELQATAQAAAAEATQRARDLAFKRYDAGVTDFYSLLNAEQERLAAQDALIQVQAGRASALLAVHKAFAARLTASAP